MTNNLFVVGGVYYVNDHELRLPPEEDRHIVHAERRPVVVVSGPNTNSFKGWPNVLIVPVSTSTTLKTGFCVKLGAGEGNLPKKGWARVTAVQPLAKNRLGDHLGVLVQDRLDEIHARLFQYMGLYIEGQAEPELN